MVKIIRFLSVAETRVYNFGFTPNAFATYGYDFV